jgi:hypothetical protein
MEQTYNDDSIAVLPRPRPELGSWPDGELLARQFSDGLITIPRAIALAGAAYPLIVGLGIVVVACVGALVSQLTWNNAGDSLIAFPAVGLVAAVAGSIWSTMVSVAILPLAYLFVRSLRLRGSIVRFGAFCGGLVGFIAIVPLVMPIVVVGKSAASDWAIALLVGPGLATILGQLGGAWGGWRTRWFEPAVARSPCENNSASPMQPWVQFGIWHLLVAAVWISLLLGLIRLSGIRFEFVLPLLVGWLVYQAATLGLCCRLVEWFGHRRMRRKSRST